MWDFVFFELSGDHRDLHVLTHSFPPRRSSELGATLGSLAVTIPAALMGEAAWCRLPLGAIRIVCCAVLAVAGLLIGLDALRHCFAISSRRGVRSEEHTSELQSLMRISYAVFCLKKKKITEHQQHA